MREHKFRMWDIENKRMIYFNLEDVWDNGYHDGDWMLEDEDVMDYTGLKDKNKVEIYEGDILRGNYIIRFGFREEVFDGFGTHSDGEYCEDYNKYIDVCGVYLEDIYGDYKTLNNYLSNYDNLEIIGNIYKKS